MVGATPTNRLLLLFPEEALAMMAIPPGNTATASAAGVAGGAPSRPEDPVSGLSGRRVLVTGGSGFLGSRVVNGLCRAGAWVLSVDLTHPREPAPVECCFERCDIRSTRLTKVVTSFAPEVVVHLAARVDVADSLRRPVLDVDVNVRGTITVAEAAADAGAGLLVFAGSCAVYGAPEQLPVGEEHPVRPTTPYGLSKATALRYVDWFTQSRGLPTTSLILGNIYGPSVAGSHRGGVIGHFLADVAARRASELHGGGRSTRDFVHVDDVADAVLRACAAPAAGAVNIGSGVETSVADVYALVRAATGGAGEAVSGPPRGGDIERMCLRADRAAQRLDWRPKIALADGIAALVSGNEMEATA